MFGFSGRPLRSPFYLLSFLQSGNSTRITRWIN
jgi:hypothetical protein